MERNPEELLHRLLAVERRAGDLESAFNQQTARVQELSEQAVDRPTLTHVNFIRNGDVNISRNDYLYYYDVTDTPGVDADVSEECFGWYVSEPDTSVESTGSITATDNTLELDTTDFVAGDAGKEIVVEGAGTAGADLVTTIATYTDNNTVELTAPAATTVTNARVRWRLMTILEDATDADYDENPATNNTLKSADHTLFATTENDPYWAKADGWAAVASGNWLCHPLKQNVIRPSLQYYNSFISSISEGEATVNFFAGIWDDSPGKKNWLEGEEIPLTATVYGSPSLTTSTTYMLVFKTNWGETVSTQKATVDAPTTFTNLEYVGLEWTMPAGVISTDIYRKIGSTYVRLNPPYPQQSYQDKGSVYDSTPTGWPTVDRTRARAYMQTTEYNVPLSKVDVWQTIQLNIPIPRDYDSSETTGRQWYIFGLLEAPPAGEMMVDRFSLSDLPGAYSVSAWDADAKRNVSSHPASGNVGGLGGGGGIDPGDTGYCPCFETLIEIEDKDGERYEIEAVQLVDNQHKYKIVNIDGVAVGYTAEISPKRQPCYELHAGQFSILRAHAQHPVFINKTDTIPLQDLKFNATILGKDGMLQVTSNLLIPEKRYTVSISLKGTQEGYWSGGIASHNNRKPPPELP